MVIETCNNGCMGLQVTRVYISLILLSQESSCNYYKSFFCYDVLCVLYTG